MAITKFTTSGVYNIVKYDDFLAGNAAYDPGGYWPIASATGTGNPTYVEFTSIPSAYTHLQVRIMCRENTSSGGVVYLRPNNDSSTNYARHQLWGDGASVTANGATAYAGYQYMNQPISTDSANIYAVGIFDILDYNNTSKYKTMRALGGYDLNGSGVIRVISGLWLSTSAITSLRIVFGNSSYNFTTASTFELYGIKEA